jgi:hypothetical protein
MDAANSLRVQALATHHQESGLENAARSEDSRGHQAGAAVRYDARKALGSVAAHQGKELTNDFPNLFLLICLYWSSQLV